MDRAALEEFARTLRDEVARGAAFECLITGDSEVQKLNSQFRGKDVPTDVLSFPSVGGTSVPRSGSGTEVPPTYLGEIAISHQRAAAQAVDFSHTLEDEIRILMLHGLLHLLGMDHERDTGAMRRAETRWRRRLGLPVGLIERVSA